MASPRNQHCASCRIGSVTFPVRMGPVAIRTVTQRVLTSRRRTARRRPIKRAACVRHHYNRSNAHCRIQVGAIDAAALGPFKKQAHGHGRENKKSRLLFGCDFSG